MNATVARKAQELLETINQEQGKPEVQMLAQADEDGNFFVGLLRQVLERFLARIGQQG